MIKHQTSYVFEGANNFGQVFNGIIELFEYSELAILLPKTNWDKLTVSRLM